MLMDLLVLKTRLMGADQANHALAEDFLAAISGHLAEGLIDRQHMVLGIQNHDALAGRFEYRAGQALFFLAMLACADVAPGAEHALHPTAGIALHSPAPVLDP